MRAPPRNSQLWPFLYWLTGLMTLAFVLWLTATNFDGTEGRAIVGTGAATGVVTFILEVLRRKAKE